MRSRPPHHRNSMEAQSRNLCRDVLAGYHSRARIRGNPTRRPIVSSPPENITGAIKRMLKVLQISVVLLGVAFFLALAGLAYYASSPPNPIEHQAFGDSNDKQPQSHTFGGFIH